MKENIKKTEKDKLIEGPSPKKRLPKLTLKEKSQIILAGLKSSPVESELKALKGKKRDAEAFEKELRSIGVREIAFLLSNLSYVGGGQGVTKGDLRNEILDGLSIRQLLRMVEKKSQKMGSGDQKK